MKFSKEFKDIKNFIYIFKHPITNEIKYVGQTSIGIKRLYSHFHKSTLKKYNQKVYNWIRKLKKEGFEPKVELLEILTNKKDLDCAEIFWIEYFKLQDNNLCNHTCGGKSTFNGDFYKTENWIKKQKESHLKQSKKTIELQTNRLFNSIAEAARFFNVKRIDVSRCVIGKSNHCQGLLFKYYSSEIVPIVVVDEYLINYNRRKTIENFKNKAKETYKKRNLKKSKPIQELVIGKIFSSLKEAGNFFNLDHSTIRNLANGKGKSKAGFIFKFYD